MIFKPFYYFDTGCAAYIVGCAGMSRCAVIDPQARDIESYLEFAAVNNMRITHVIDTHIHADHKSGGRILAEQSAALYCLHQSAEVNFQFEPLEDEQELEVGNIRLRVIHTSGHTPESICLLVSDLRRGPEPWFLLTGDTLFSGGVGRPDLPGDSRKNAAALYNSLREKILLLPETLEIHPAHFAGSVCGAGISGKPMTTLAFEKRWNPLLSLSREDFIDKISADIPKKLTEMNEILLFNQGRNC
ncbi:MAG: MBL fold metallo-hydrolase [Acidobacteriota bacterium]